MDTNFLIVDFFCVAMREERTYQGDVIEAFSYTLRYLDLLLHTDNL